MSLLGRIGIGALTLGGSELLGEDTMANIPVLNAIGGYKSDETKALLAKQKQLAEEARKRQFQNQQTRMNGLAQQMMAFNPRNQAMAQMFGPDAAFTPDQMAQMAADPTYRGAWGSGNDQEDIEQLKARDAEAKRQAMLRGGFQQPGPGPAPFRMPNPQAGRR